MIHRFISLTLLLPLYSAYSTVDFIGRLQDNYSYFLETAQICPNALRVFSPHDAIFDQCIDIHDFDVQECDKVEGGYPKGDDVGQMLICERDQIVSFLNILLTHGGMIPQNVIEYHSVSAQEAPVIDKTKQGRITRTEQLKNRIQKNLEYVLNSYSSCSPSSFYVSNLEKERIEVLNYYREGCFNTQPPKKNSFSPEHGLLETMRFSDPKDKENLLKPFLNKITLDELKAEEKKKGIVHFPTSSDF